MLPSRVPTLTSPFKFRQDTPCEVRSRLVELSVEQTNGSFLSVSQRSTSWRYSLCMAKGEKVLVEFLLWTCLQGKWKTLFHVPHAITSKKTVTWDNTTNCLQKACLLRFVKTRGKKLLQQAWIFDASFHCYSTEAFSCLLPLFEKFRCFSGGKQYKKESKWQDCVTFEVTFRQDIFTAEEKHSLRALLQYADLFLRKKRIRETTELLLGRCKNDFVHFWVETKFGKPVLILCWHCCKRMHKRYKVPHHIRCFQMDNAFGMVVLSWICARQGLAQISLSSFRWYSWDCEVCHQSKTFAFSKRNLRAQKQTAVFKVIVTERRFYTVKFIQSSRWLVSVESLFSVKMPLPYSKVFLQMKKSVVELRSQ